MVDSDDDGGDYYAEIMAAMVNAGDEGGNHAELMAAYPLDILEYANSYAFVIDMPGLDPDDVRVQVKPCNVLLISGEGRRVEVEGAEYIRMERRSMRKFVRKFALPENANTGKITTVLRHGVLTVTVEKLPPPQPRTIEVKHEQLGIRGEDERKLRIGAVDRMSMLPDELLLCVLSFLSFKEATATCLLCRRWRYLHTLTAELNFDGTKLIKEVRRSHYKGLDEVVGKYMRWVDGVVRLNRSSYLEKFRVLFFLRESHTQQIDEWVRFALSRKVQSLELISTMDCNQMEYYTLNLHNFDCDLNFLKKLSTQSVKVSGEAVEMLLRNCPLLEQVSIAKSQELLGLEIIKPFPTFRSLEILKCSNLSSVVVGNSNIVSFKYWGDRVNKVALVNVPLLTEIWVYGWCTERVEDVIEMFSSVLPQLHTFKICITCSILLDLRGFCSRFCSFVKMSNLKQLVVDISDMYYKEDLLPLIDLIKAFPSLQRFVIQESYKKDCGDDFVEGIPIEIQMAKSADRMILKANTELKEVEFVCYRGVSEHFELLKYLVENAIALETIVVDPWGFKESNYIFSFDQIPRRKYNDKIIARANALKHLVPIGINVKIL